MSQSGSYNQHTLYFPRVHYSSLWTKCKCTRQERNSGLSRRHQGQVYKWHILFIPRGHEPKTILLLILCIKSQEQRILCIWDEIRKVLQNISSPQRRSYVFFLEWLNINMRIWNKGFEASSLFCFFFIASIHFPEIVHFKHHDIVSNDYDRTSNPSLPLLLSFGRQYAPWSAEGRTSLALMRKIIFLILLKIFGRGIN